MSDAPGQLGGRRLERMRKPDLFELVRNSKNCLCTQAGVARVLADREERRNAKRTAKDIDQAADEAGPHGRS